MTKPSSNPTQKVAPMDGGTDGRGETRHCGGNSVILLDVKDVAN